LPDIAHDHDAFPGSRDAKQVIHKAHISRTRDNYATKMTEDVPGDLANILGPTEQIQLYIKQRMYHPTLYVDSVAITTQRIILRHPYALGLKKEYTDFGYQDIANVVLERGVLRSTVKCMLRFGGEPLSLTDLPNAQAEKAYGIIRENLTRLLTLSAIGTASSK
jgi:hypothetical protein